MTDEVLSSVLSLFFLIVLTTNIDPIYLASLRNGRYAELLFMKALNLEILIFFIIPLFKYFLFLFLNIGNFPIFVSNFESLTSLNK